MSKKQAAAVSEWPVQNLMILHRRVITRAGNLYRSHGHRHRHGTPTLNGFVSHRAGSRTGRAGTR